jgi:hypothetical protein
MAGDDASEEVLRDIMKGLMGTLSSGTGRTPTVGETQLRDFMEGKIDLDPVIETALAQYFYTNSTTFDPTSDLLVQPSPPIGRLGVAPERWVHPCPEVEAAKKAYQEAVAAYNASISPPPPPRKPQTEPTNIGRLPPDGRDSRHDLQKRRPHPARRGLTQVRY